MSLYKFFVQFTYNLFPFFVILVHLPELRGVVQVEGALVLKQDASLACLCEKDLKN
jgi:hypothetical protein